MSKEKIDLSWLDELPLPEWTPVPTSSGIVAYLCGYCGANEIWVDEKLWDWEYYETVPF